MNDDQKPVVDATDETTTIEWEQFGLDDRETDDLANLLRMVKRILWRGKRSIYTADLAYQGRLTDSMLAALQAILYPEYKVTRQIFPDQGTILSFQRYLDRRPWSRNSKKAGRGV
jgi:hypothetical protein